MTAEHKTYMLDTNVFNDVLDGKIPLTSLRGRWLFVIGVQVHELRATRDDSRRADLLAVFDEIRPGSTLASSFCFGIEGAGFDEANWNDGSGKFDKMLALLQHFDNHKRKKKNRLNQVRDILIAESAIKNGATLISNDSNLRKVVFEFGGSAMGLCSF